MAIAYDDYYQTEDFFGAPYPELMDFFSAYPTRGKLLDVGCGQGRNAIPLAQHGFEVTGIDHSRVGLQQMQAKATEMNLSVSGMVTDIYTYEGYGTFDCILLDSMFHFAKNDKQRETKLIWKIIMDTQPGALIVFCIQDTGKKVEILSNTLDELGQLTTIHEASFAYVFVDDQTGHTSTTPYKMLGIRKDAADDS